MENIKGDIAMQKKYILWDFDGTLAYRDETWSQTIFVLLQEYGCRNIKLEDVRPLLTKGFPWHTPDISHKDFFGELTWWDYMTLHFAKIIQSVGVDEGLSIEIAGQIKTRYLDITQWHLYDDTIPCLEKTINLGYNNIIVSNHVPELPDLVTGLGIDRYFRQIYSSANLEYEKPNIRMYKTVLDNLEDNGDVTMIGDNYIADVEGAINAGIKAILVRKENIRNYQKYCKSLDEIFNIFI